MKKNKKDKKGISLIVLIISIIVIIILVSTIMLTVTKDNSISNANEATFKQNMLTIQDEYAMYLSNKYKENPTEFKQENVNLYGDEMENELPSTKNYKDKIAIVKGQIVWIGEKDSAKYYDWFKQVINSVDIEDLMEKVDGVPIPIGFKYKEGTKETGLVIEDENENEFVWVVANEKTYVKDFSFPRIPSINSLGTEDSLPIGIADETADVRKYGGFYIGRYEAGIPDGDTATSNKTGIPITKKGVIVWTDIDYNHAKASAESMIVNSFVQTGLLTGTAWDTTCHWIEDILSTINPSASLTDSRYYGNYINSLAPANDSIVQKRRAGFNENWKVKNIYDLAGNVWEWTNEKQHNNCFIYRGGTFPDDGSRHPVSYRSCFKSTETHDLIGFRVRLYIK